MYGILWHIGASRQEWGDLFVLGRYLLNVLDGIDSDLSDDISDLVELRSYEVVKESESQDIELESDAGSEVSDVGVSGRSETDLVSCVLRALSDLKKRPVSDAEELFYGGLADWARGCDDILQLALSQDFETFCEQSRPVVDSWCLSIWGGEDDAELNGVLNDFYGPDVFGLVLDNLYMALRSQGELPA